MRDTGLKLGIRLVLLKHKHLRLDNIYLVRKFLPLANSLVIAALFGSAAVIAENRQEHIHHMGSGVMSFDLSKTVHIFKMTESGGVEKVIVKNPADTEQITFIRMHLRHEAEKFQKGDYSDPASLHGANMPGLEELQAGAASVTVIYADLPLGAEITFKTSDIHMLTAIHRWFGAQLSEHGADAMPE